LETSSQSQLNGINNALEGYINNFNITPGKMYRSQCKRDKPHLVAIISDNKIEDKHWSCTAVFT